MWSPSVPLPSERLKPLLGWETAKPLCGSLNQNSSQYAPHSITGMLPCQQERFFMSLKYNEDQWLLPWFIKLPLCTPCEVFIFHCDPELCSFFPPAAGKTAFYLLVSSINQQQRRKRQKGNTEWSLHCFFPSQTLNPALETTLLKENDDVSISQFSRLMTRWCFSSSWKEVVYVPPEQLKSRMGMQSRCGLMQISNPGLHVDRLKALCFWKRHNFSLIADEIRRW